MPNSRVISTVSGARQYQAILHWRHERGPAESLTRFQLAGMTGTPVAVISELRSNTRGREIGSDFPAVADALLAALPAEFDVSPKAIVWVAHYGAFSSYEALDAPDRIVLDWDGEHYHGDISGHLHIRRSEIGEVLGGIELAPVEEVLTQLGSAS